jgi:anti-sigma factor RsiW
MSSHHVTHLLTRYVHGQLRAVQRARVINHVRTCSYCRAALAREEQLADDLRHEMPRLGEASARQLAGVWAGVWQEFNTPRRPPRSAPMMWLPGLLGMMLVLVIALPLLVQSSTRVQAAPSQARPVSTASPTPGVAETDEAWSYAQGVGQYGVDLPEPQATVALALVVGATPAPVPAATVSPDAWTGGVYRR